MAGAPVNAGEALARGIRTEFLSTYKRMIQGADPRVKMLMDLAMPSDKLAELYGYYESAPYPRRWPRGQNAPRKGFNSVQFEVANQKWGIAIDWQEEDEDDDQLKDLKNQASDAATGFALQPERIAFQMLTGATDPDLLNAVPNAPDGVALFSATDAGGGDRFGYSGGNIVSGSGVATSAVIRTDLYSAVKTFKRFQDTEGQPLLPEAVVDQPLLIIFNSDNEKVFNEAFQQRQVITTVTSPGNLAASTSNIILDANRKYILWPTSRISDNDWFVVATGCPKKPLFEQVRRALRIIYSDGTNSDVARDTHMKSVFMDQRSGYGVGPAYSIIKVNN